MEGEKDYLVATHRAKSETLSIEMNKESFEATGVSFDDTASCLPHTLVCSESGTKARVMWNDELLVFQADLNGYQFEHLPYLDASFIPSDITVKTLQADVYLNDKEVHSGAAEWRPILLQQRIFREIAEDEPIVSIWVSGINSTSSATMNELIDGLLNQDNIAEQGI